MQFLITMLLYDIFQIWLKDAVQCRDCAMCCHKKCVIKCQAGAPCTNASTTRPVVVPKFQMTEQQFEVINCEKMHKKLVRL